MKLRMLFFLSITILNVNAILSQNSPEGIIDTFFVQLENSNTDTALDYLYSTNPWMSQNEDGIKNLKSQMASLNDVSYIGENNGYDLIVEKEITSKYKLFSYLVRYDRQPIRFTFQFYKPKDVWKIYSFKYDGNLDAELEEAAKLHIITGGY